MTVQRTGPLPDGRGDGTDVDSGPILLGIGSAATLHNTIPIKAGYVTGFLFGDAVLFFALAAPAGE